MPLSQPFVIATEGPTVDGRNISRQWISDMAKSYDPKVYTAIANLEHYLSAVPDSLFKAYGKVVSLSTKEAEILGEKRLQLLAVVDASDEIVALQKKGQKAFPSAEVLNNFVSKGIAYLTGLAFTDQPASLATETMKFSIGGSEGERFSFANEVCIDFEAERETKPNEGATMFSKISNLLGLGKKDNDARFADFSAAITAIAESQKSLLDKFADQEMATAQFVSGELKPSDLDKRLETLSQEFAALKETLSKTDGDHKARPTAAGGDGQIKTDC